MSDRRTVSYTVRHPERNALGPAYAATVDLRLAAGALDILDTLSRRDTAELTDEQVEYLSENLDAAWLALNTLSQALAPWPLSYRIPVSLPCPEEVGR